MAEGTHAPPANLLSLTRKLRTPIPQVEKIIANGTVTYFSDRRHHALELITSNSRHDRIYKFFVKAFFNAFLGTVALIDEKEQKLVYLLIGKAELTFIGLTYPQICRRRLIDNGGWDSQGTRELSHLRLIQIAYWIRADAISPHIVV